MSSLNIWKWQQESQQVQLFLSLLLLHLEYDPVSPPSTYPPTLVLISEVCSPRIWSQVDACSLFSKSNTLPLIPTRGND